MSNKKRKPNYKVIVYIVVFIASLVAAFYYVPKYTFTHRETVYPKTDKVCVVLMGDSNVAIPHFEGTMEEKIGELTGFEVYNIAMGGTTAAKLDRTNEQDKLYDRCCLYNLVNLPITGEVEMYLDDHTEISKVYSEAVERITTASIIDFNKVDYVVLTYGTNDYFTGALADNEEDPYDVYSYGGALRSSIEKLHEHYPNIKFLITTPTYCYVKDGDRNIPALGYDCGGGTLRDYMDVCHKLAKEYDYVAVVDTYNKIDVNESNYFDYMSDNLHIWAIAQGRWCEVVAKALKNLEE